jgi:hypothetical protein
MRCHDCGSAEPIGVCAFCGRAVCAECHSEMPYIFTVYIGANQVPKAIVVSGALWCGSCRPQPEPIEMPEIY